MLLPFSFPASAASRRETFFAFGRAAIGAAMPEVARVAEVRVAGRFLEQ
jgi:hypothetical protein